MKINNSILKIGKIFWNEQNTIFFAEKIVYIFFIIGHFYHFVFVAILVFSFFGTIQIIHLYFHLSFWHSSFFGALLIKNTKAILFNLSISFLSVSQRVIHPKQTFYSAAFANKWKNDKKQERWPCIRDGKHKNAALENDRF